MTTEREGQMSEHHAQAGLTFPGESSRLSPSRLTRQTETAAPQIHGREAGDSAGWGTLALRTTAVIPRWARISEHWAAHLKWMYYVSCISMKPWGKDPRNRRNLLWEPGSSGLSNLLAASRN